MPLTGGHGRWKLNVSILKDVDFISSFDRFWKSWQLGKASFSSLQAWWDRGKEHIKGLAIHFSCAKNTDLLFSCSLLCSLASHLKGRIDAGSVSLMGIYENVLLKV